MEGKDHRSSFKCALCNLSEAPDRSIPWYYCQVSYRSHVSVCVE